MTVSVVEDRSLTWSTSTSRSLEPMIPSIIMPTSSLLVFGMTIFRMGQNSIVNDENPTWWHLGRIVKNKNTRVWEAQDRIGIVRPGDSSEGSRTWLSQIEDDGEKKYRARFTKQELWDQKRKLWKKRRGKESGDKTAWTKNSWRLLAMGSQRAVL